MSQKKPWDLTSGSSFTGALNWLRKNSGATLIVAIRPQDATFSMHPDMQPMEAVTMLRNELPALLQHMIDRRAAETGKTRNGRARPERNLDAEDC